MDDSLYFTEQHLAVREMVRKALGELAKLTPEQLIEDRYEKFRRMGNFFAEGAA